MSADVLPFPNRRTCWKCIHYAPEQNRCLLFDAPIDSEVYAAKDCDGFEVAE